MDINTLTLTTDQGITFTFVLHKAGVAIERNALMPYAPPSDEVAVYDARYPFTRFGQFVSSYHPGTFTGQPLSGIIMDFAYPEWSLDIDTVREVGEWLLSLD